MPYIWTYERHGAAVYRVDDTTTAVSPEGMTFVALTVNGLVAQSVCDHLNVVDPTGSLHHRNGDCSVWKNLPVNQHEHDGKCEYVDNIPR